MKIKPTVKIISNPFSLVPVIDVFFLLLVLFTISSSVTFWPGQKVETEVRLPTTRLATMSVADKLIVTITNSGDLFFNSKPMADIEDLERELRELVRASQQEGAGDEGSAHRSRRPMLVLRADRRLPFEQIVQVELLARELNLDVFVMLDPSSRSVPIRILEADDQ